ncbi:hypothetical protein C8Q80DRAFT_620402 [Daedaleopsis nitida]|nr:hypothetical protein C8Q80DRAFT_620402 [Daedaleopsis nitida]
MTRVLAAVAQLFNRNSPPEEEADSWPPPRVANHLRGGHGRRPSSQTHSVIIEPSTYTFGDYALLLTDWHSVLEASPMTDRVRSDATEQRNYTSQSGTKRDVIGLLVDLEQYKDDDTLCRPRNCSHCRSPPTLVYSPPSSSSLALSPPSVTTPSFGDMSYSPPSQVITFTNSASLLPAPELHLMTGSLAQRRGIKQLPLMHSRTPSDIASDTSLSVTDGDGGITPLSSILDTPGFQQRVVGFIRLSSSPDFGTMAETPPQEYSFDDSFTSPLEDPFGRSSASYFEDIRIVDMPLVKRSTLEDFTIYRELPTNRGGHYYTEKCPMHGKARLYIGVSDILESPTEGLSSGSLKVPKASTGARIFRQAGPQANAGIKGKSQYRPLQLPQKLARQGFEQAQAEPGSTPTSPNHRPLYLPQLIARRAAGPPRRPIPPSRSFTYPLGSHPRHGGSAQSLSRRRREEVQSGPPSQLDDIISLLGESGILEESLDDSMIATSGSAPEDLSGAASLVSLSEFLRTGGAASVGLARPLDETLEPLSREVEDILGLLGDTTVTSLDSAETLVQRDDCAFAL